MYSFFYTNLFISGIPSGMEPRELAKVLELYGEMNSLPCAFSPRFRKGKYNPYMSPEENMIPRHDEERYNVVLYGFRVNLAATENMGRMLLIIIQMNKRMRHSWIDSDRQPQYIFISEDNCPVPMGLFNQLLWSEDRRFSTIKPSVNVVTPVEQTVTFVENKMTQKETKSEDTTKFDKALWDQIEKETRNDMLRQPKEVTEYNRWFLNTVRNRHAKQAAEAEAAKQAAEAEAAEQAAEREYIANWAKNKERTELIQMRNDS